MDILEKYIANHKAAFDIDEPSDTLWHAIEMRLDANDDTTLESFINKNRTDFDAAEPSQNVWLSVEKYLASEDIEKFARENRLDFNSETPNLKIWANIEKSLEKATASQKNVSNSNNVRRFGWLLRTAAAVALLVIGAAAGIFITQKETPQRLVMEIAPDFDEAEQFYVERLNTQMSKLVGYNPDPSVLSDLSQIDNVQAELKKELLTAPTESRADIVKRMIENYQIKVSILERVLNYIEKHRIEKQNSHSHNEKRTQNI